MSDSKDRKVVPVNRPLIRTWSVLVVIITALLLASEKFGIIDLSAVLNKDADPTDVDYLAFGVVVSIFIIFAVIIEQACEVLIGIFDGNTKMQLIEIQARAQKQLDDGKKATESGMTAPSATELATFHSNFDEANRKLMLHKRQIAPLASLLCLILASFAVLAGFHFIELITDALRLTNPSIGAGDVGKPFKLFDGAVSVLLLSGGADRFHQIIKDALPSDEQSLARSILGTTTEQTT